MKEKFNNAVKEVSEVSEKLSAAAATLKHGIMIGHSMTWEAAEKEIADLAVRLESVSAELREVAAGIPLKEIEPDEKQPDHGE